EIVPRYERLVGTPSRDGRFDALTLEQSERCIDELIRDETSVAGAASRFSLAQSFQVTKWRIDGQEAPTQSSLIIHYGQLPCLSTFLQFETVEEFQSVQKVLAELGLCKLNEKHLNPMKKQKKKWARRPRKPERESSSCDPRCWSFFYYSTREFCWPRRVPRPRMSKDE